MSDTQLRDLADQAWYRYQHWLRRLAVPRGTQLDIDVAQVSAHVREWRGIWCACERELDRVRRCA